MLFPLFRSPRPRVLAAALLSASVAAQAQAPKRCDLSLTSTPGGTGAASACLDLAALANGGPPIRTAANATRISRDGFRFCPGAFRIETPAAADVVFIFDNSGSMFGEYAYVDAARGDTLYYFNADGCADTTTTGTVTLSTPRRQTICPSLRSNAGCRSYAGDPYEARGKVIRSAIDYMASWSPLSTAGVTGFARATMHALPPQRMNDPAAVARAKDSVKIDSAAYTYYGPPLALANRWLHDTTLTRTRKQAIVFISDGAPGDASGAGSYLNSVDRTIPIYSIFLGQVSTPDTANLKHLSDLTQGTFTRVAPNDINAIQGVMQNIVKGLLINTMPQSIEVSNAAFAPPQVSRSTGLARNADSSVSLALDSILALKLGANPLTVTIRMDDTAKRTYTFTVRADGPAAAVTDSNLTCFDPPALALLDPQGKPATEYPAGATGFQLRLLRSGGDDLAAATVAAAARDSARPGWGDQENLSLPRSAAGTYQGPSPVHSDLEAPKAGDGILQAAAEGALAFSWTHPRDPRETASLIVPGRKIPVVPPFISVRRLRDVAGGTVINHVVADPVVVFGAGDLKPGAGGTAGPCLANCLSGMQAAADPAGNPAFLFKTAAPFAYRVTVFDNLGRFVNSGSGAIDAAKWATLPRDGDSVAVAMAILPVASNGNRIGSGVYILRATLTTASATVPAGPGRETKVLAGERVLTNRFGFLRPR